MLNLYWKIFLGFWVTGLVLGGGAIFVSQKLQSDTPIELRGLSPAELVNRTSFIVRRLPGDIDDWKTRLGEHDILFYIDNSPANSLASVEVPDAIAEIFSSLESNPGAEYSTWTRLKIGKREQSASGDPIKYVLDMPSITVFRLRQLSERLAVQFLLALTISAAACMVLARYLTRNLKQISAASRALAGGDLNARTRVSNRALKDELSLLAEDFNMMADAMQNGIENQKRLVRDISHELRSPLARMQIALELARQSINKKNNAVDNTQSNQALKRIETEADRLNEMIGQLLSMPDQIAALDDTVDIGELLSSIAEDNQIEATRKNVQFNFISAPGEALVRANAVQLHSAFENIVRNAIHYTDDDTTIDISIDECVAPETGIKTSTNETEKGFACYKILIADNGPGVPDKDLLNIFDPFYRVDLARNRKTGGYGIGLAIVERVISAHKGGVQALNSANGLTVEVLLPKLRSS